MARAKINTRIVKLIDQCNFLIHEVGLNAEQIVYLHQLMAWAGPFAARCRLNPFRTVGLSEPTDSMLEIEEVARARLEAIGRVKLTALDLDRFPAVAALAEFLEHRVNLDLKALRVCHETDRLATYASWHRSRWSGTIADLVPSHSATPAGVQAEANGHPLGLRCGDWS